MTWSVQTLAEALGLECRGDPRGHILGVATLERAGSSDLAFVARAAFADQLAGARAGCVIVPPELVDRVAGPALVAERPHLAFAQAARLLRPERQASGVRAPSAVVDPAADVAADVDIDAQAVVAADAVIGAGSMIGAGAIIGRGACIGTDCRIGPGVLVGDGSRLGARVRIQPGAVIGAEGFGYVWDEDQWVRVPQLGRVIIGNDVEIGANTTIDRGALDDTIIGDDVLLDNQIQVAHNVRIGEHTAIAGCVGIAGSAIIGRRCMIGGAAGILGHLTVADDVHITAMSLVSRSILEPGTYSSGTPLERQGDWRRNAARFRQLDVLTRRVQALERHQGGQGGKQ